MNATFNSNVPALSNEGGLSAYLEQIKKFPMLAAEEEYMLGKKLENYRKYQSS
jgi:RNA polymerase sigma-32 factor